MKKLMGVMFLVAFAAAFVAGFGIPQATASPLAVCAFVQQGAIIYNPEDVMATAVTGLEMKAAMFETQGAIRPTTRTALEGSSEYQLNSGSNQRAWMINGVANVQVSVRALAGTYAAGGCDRRVWPIYAVINDVQWAPSEEGSISGSYDCAGATSINAEYAVRTVIRMPEVVQAIVV